MIRTAFFGSPFEAVPILAALRTVSQVTMVASQPDRPRGRGLRVRPSAVSEAAGDWGLRVVHEDDEMAAGLDGIDVAVVAAYGNLVPERLLEIPRRGFLNVHFSLLPRWRGASPVVRAVLAGDAETGVTLIEMDAGLDTGPIVAQATVAVRPRDTAGTLTARLTGLGADMVARHLADFVGGSMPARPQDESAATAAGKVTADEAFIDPARHRVGAVVRAVRAFNPRPGAWGVVEGTRMKLLDVEGDDAEVEPGVARMVEGRVVLGAVGGSVRLVRVQPEGRAAMDAESWMNGRRGKPARFER